MQLSSLFLSATALIAQAAAADYLLFPTIKRLEPYGAARIESSSQGGPWLPEHVGFPQNTNSPLAEIPLDQGDIGSKFYLQSVGDRKWALISRDVFHIPVPSIDITGPFAIDDDDKFLYRGGEPWEHFDWVVCESDDFKIHLVENFNEAEFGNDCAVTQLGAFEAEPHN